MDTSFAELHEAFLTCVEQLVCLIAHAQRIILTNNLIPNYEPNIRFHHTAKPRRPRTSATVRKTVAISACRLLTLGFTCSSSPDAKRLHFSPSLSHHGPRLFVPSSLPSHVQPALGGTAARPLAGLAGPTPRSHRPDRNAHCMLGQVGQGSKKRWF